MKIKRHISWQASHRVGYKNPPTWTRFKKGVSGNPHGRPKKDDTFKAIAERELRRCVTIREGGQTKSVTLKTAIIKRCLADAAQGKVRNLEFVLKVLNKTAPVQAEEELTTQEQELWKYYFKGEKREH